MRTPVHRIHGKKEAETAHDLFASELSKHYTVKRNLTIEWVDAGQNKSFVADILLPDHKLVVEIQEKQENKAIIAEIAREKIARAAGWHICRFPEKEIKGDIDTVLYKIGREIYRRR